LDVSIDSIGKLKSRNSLNLVVNTTLPQVFDFSVALSTTASSSGVYDWYAGTQEAVIWAGTVDSVNGLAPNPTYSVISAYDKCQIGYCLALRETTLVAAGQNVAFYDLESDGCIKPGSM
jgi:hypothetical protein